MQLQQPEEFQEEQVRGVIRKPPPTPNIPESIPTNIPRIRNIIGLIESSAIGR